MLEMGINRYAYDKLVIGGDFNTDFSRKNAHSEYLNHFLERNSLVSVWHMTGAQRQDDVYTYKTHDGHRSCIDHFMISATLQGFVKSVSVLDSSACCNDMGHFPILITLKCDVYTKNDVKEGQKGKCKIAWHQIMNNMSIQWITLSVIQQTSMICHLCNALTGIAKIAHIGWKLIRYALCLQICVFPPLILPCLRWQNVMPSRDGM